MFSLLHPDKKPISNRKLIATFLLSSSQVGDKLRQLETSWVGLVSKNYEIEQARSEIRFQYLTSLFTSGHHEHGAGV